MRRLARESSPTVAAMRRFALRADRGWLRQTEDVAETHDQTTPPISRRRSVDEPPLDAHWLSRVDRRALQLAQHGAHVRPPSSARSRARARSPCRR